jgi:hypothetical protein
MIEDSRYYSQLRAATVGLAIQGSTRQIVEEIAALIPSPVLAHDEPYLVDVRSA